MQTMKKATLNTFLSITSSYLKSMLKIGPAEPEKFSCATFGQQILEHRHTNQFERAARMSTFTARDKTLPE